MNFSVLSNPMADEAQCLDALVQSMDWNQARAQRISKSAAELITALRARKMPAGQLEAFLQKYKLTSAEGLAMMGLAEALLRIPDTHTAAALIQDKIGDGDFLKDMGGTQDWMVKAAGLGLSITRATLDSVFGKLGQPMIREAMAQAMRMMGSKFVLGETIESAMKNAQPYERKGYALSYDMLGEGARTTEDAQRYMRSYVMAVQTITPPSGISVKLSALHPRYEYAQRDHCVPALQSKLLELSRLAAERNIALTVDAEEMDRLELSLQIIQAVIAASDLKDWAGFGLAVQAYQKRAPQVIDWAVEQARVNGRRIQIRLVKGAYWDSEIKRGQVLGLEDYSVFTRKVNTDVSYLACAAKMLHASDVIFPLFATHNAHTAAAIVDLAGGDSKRFSFQRLHGMGEALHDTLLERYPGLRSSIYAPVGPQADLLAYLVRRLLENGANTSFVNRLMDKNAPLDDLVQDPVAAALQSPTRRHKHVLMPSDLFRAEDRNNSAGIDLSDEPSVKNLLRALESSAQPVQAAPIIDGQTRLGGTSQPVRNPALQHDIVGEIALAQEGLIAPAIEAARRGFEEWNAQSFEARAAVLDKAADLFEKHGSELMGLLIREGGKTIPDALSELREAVDFCRYYAARARLDCAPVTLPGPTGERNIIQLEGRGIFVCIAPWNFPLAIFTGQVVAALVMGNAVIAKPSSNTPLIALRAVELLHRAGVPDAALAYFPASGAITDKLLHHPDIAGVAFTGSTQTAWSINRALASRDAPIAPLVAETGGQNAMIVDSSALPEQVVDDVIESAFTSAGQRCSALRLLCLQEEVADKILHMLKGAMAEIRLGPGLDLASDIGPVIDEKAKAGLQQHVDMLQQKAQRIAAVDVPDKFAKQGSFFAPCAYEIKDLSILEREVFGPILHVIRFRARDVDTLVGDINA
ncbi:MAG: bifunctional proline dehydrogenase/L-glutamate gamma-semialdehyde dehydrogenase PutA, partial [Alphaproteobacteria bacterium]|nr:bifunctional proline dehydrogenase/L-glutamate gamma-semialdehyde dehydrogenase PutA [Alphaproteobacteria bacterium]